MVSSSPATRAYLASFESSRTSVAKSLDELRSLTADNARQGPRIDSVREQTSRWTSLSTGRETSRPRSTEVHRWRG